MINEVYMVMEVEVVVSFEFMGIILCFVYVMECCRWGRKCEWV